MSHAFISYLRDDEEIVNRLYKDLRSYGIEVWLDKEEIKPGERWKEAIRTAIREGAFFIACFSKSYAERTRSYMIEELILAIEELRQRPTDRAWFIPVLLSGDVIPDRAIGAGETLHDLHWVDLRTDWSHGIAQIVQVIQPEAIKATSPPRPPRSFLAIFIAALLIISVLLYTAIFRTSDGRAIEITLKKGWNTVAYTKAEPRPIAEMLAPINHILTSVKDEAGRIYIPAYGINQIDSLQPGKGYQLYVTKDTAFVYPE